MPGLLPTVKASVIGMREKDRLIEAYAWCIRNRPFSDLFDSFSSPAGKTRRSLTIMLCQGLLLVIVIFRSNLLEAITPDDPQRVEVILGSDRAGDEGLTRAMQRPQTGSHIWRKYPGSWTFMICVK